MDFDLEPCQENYGRIQNFPCEDGLGQPYKPTSYVELHLCHLQLLLGLVCIFPLLESMHVLIKFAHPKMCSSV